MHYYVVVNFTAVSLIYFVMFILQGGTPLSGHMKNVRQFWVVFGLKIMGMEYTSIRNFIASAKGCRELLGAQEQSSEVSPPLRAKEAEIFVIMPFRLA